MVAAVGRLFVRLKPAFDLPLQTGQKITLPSAEAWKIKTPNKAMLVCSG